MAAIHVIDNPITNRDALASFLDMLHAIEDRILALLDAKLSLSEIIAATPTVEFDSTWGRRYITGEYFTRMILAGLGVDDHRRTRCLCSPGAERLLRQEA
jgi:hypothetical protein